MEKYEEMGNNEIMTKIISLQAEHEAIKIRINQELDNLDNIEKSFMAANKVLANRIKGQTNE